MNQGTIIKWALQKGVELDSEKADKMLLYSELIHSTNKKFNITGFKGVDDIAKTLIIGSIEPLYKKNVPRGTFFADIGSGAGIPGVVAAIFFEGAEGVLIESNRKKADFIQKAIEKLEVKNIRVICGRAEDAAREDKTREAFELCFARAFAGLYVTLEIGSCLLKPDGGLYVYSNEPDANISEDTLAHAERLGIGLLSRTETEENGISSGMLFRKVAKSSAIYPRRFAVIKREAKGF